MYPDSFKKLITHFSSLPSVGPKLAERLVMYLAKQPPEAIELFAQSLAALKDVTTCTRCFNIADKELCAICTDTNRDQGRICVVEEPLDIFSIERTKSYTGLYHVLGGVLESTNPKDKTSLTISELLQRVRDDNTTEVILATNLTTEGDITALYLKKKLSDLDVPISRIARGMSTGSDIEYADEITLSAALQNREEMSNGK